MPTKTKNAIEKEFEGRLLILGEFNTVRAFIIGLFEVPNARG
jgi:hypothetical protein